MHPMNGLLLIDKPVGCTSHDVVHKVRRILGLRQIGHSGTLDPLASGLLVLLLGEATKISDYILSGDKSYSVRVRLGVKTDSGDSTGTVIEKQDVSYSAAEIQAAVERLQGEMDLPVPSYSAVKVDGKRLYKYARSAEEVSIPIRKMNFHEARMLACGEDWADVDLKCSKGGYVRSWAVQLGQELGCGSTVEVLRRTFSDPYGVANALTLEDLEKKWVEKDERHGQVLGPAWISLQDALPNWRTVYVQGHEEHLMKNGQIANQLKMRLLPFIVPGQTPPGVRVISKDTSELVALLVADAGKFYGIRRVFHGT